jgi:polyisoprenoid-binding protein YceI
MTTATQSTVSEPTTTTTARYVLDGSHTHVGFSVRHMMIANVRGEFQKVTGEVSYDPKNPKATTLTASIEAASIHTREEARDTHLRSADFFDVENYPTLTFVSKSVTQRSDGLDVVGDLTIRGTTKEVTLSVDEITPEHTDPWGNLRVGAVAKTKISRADFGMRWNNAIEAGGVLVGDQITIQIEAELVKQK